MLKEEKVLVERLTENRLGIGQTYFRKVQGYEFPVAEIEIEKAERLCRAEIRDGTNNFRIAIPIQEPVIPEDPPEPVIVQVNPEDEPVEASAEPDSGNEKPKGKPGRPSTKKAGI